MISRKITKIFKRSVIKATITIIVTLNCSGLVKLKLPSDESTNSKDSWLTAYKSNQRHNAVEYDLEPPYQILWKKKYKSVVTDHPLATHKYIIMTLKNGNLALFDIEQGGILGDGRIAPGFEHTPTIDHNILYFGANLGKETLIAMNLLNLKKLWKINLPHIYTPPLILNDKIYVGTNSGQLFCVEKITGKKNWHFPAQASIQGIPAELGGKIYFSDVKANMYCIDGQSGELSWSTQLQTNIYNGPVIAEQRVFIGSTSGVFYALSTDSGKIIWKTKTNGSIYGNAAYKNGTLYFGNNAHYMTAVDAGSGEIAWQFKTNGIINTAPLVGLDYIYFGSWDKRLYVLSQKTGELIYQIEFKRPIKASPIIYKSRLYIQTANDRFYCLATSNQQKS
jgi:outer membrane protein assembly factor BamB